LHKLIYDQIFSNRSGIVEGFTVYVTAIIEGLMLIVEVSNTFENTQIIVNITLYISWSFVIVVKSCRYCC